MDSASFVHMNRNNYLWVFSAIIMSCFLFRGASAQGTMNNQQIEVAMRTIGHEVLLAHCDSTSRVLPVKKEGNLYAIRFDTEFVFQAPKLIEAIEEVVNRTNLATNYIVEMQECQSGDIIYSYQIKEGIDLNSIPCGLREQPEACYILRILILEEEQNNLLAHKSTSSPLGWLSSIFTGIINNGGLSISLFLLIGMGLYFYRKKSNPKTDPSIIEIGNYVFDDKKMTLSLADNSVELSGKESDLLSLLYLSVNTTVKRGDILRNVWGDQGDYVGRTLDVFISKLRKKLEDDPSVKITNIRGIGYRLVVA